MYYINIVIHYNKRYILIIILIVYNITKTEHYVEHTLKPPSAVCIAILRT